jgi:hypothetical protein
MKKQAKIVGRALCYRILICPFCGQQTTENEAMPWCVNCRTEYYESTNRKTGESRLMFDDKRKTPRFALGKALNVCSGIRIGKP